MVYLLQLLFNFSHHASFVMPNIQPPLYQLGTDDPLPPSHLAWGPASAAPGLLAIGGGLSVQRLLNAYGQGCFPWYSDGQPVMWWSPDPRMVLPVAQFRLRRSLRQAVKKFLNTPGAQVRFDSAFSQVIQACAHAPRPGQNGTWIVHDIVQAYEQLHLAGHAHSIEVWLHDELIGGLYVVGIGRAVFGESMFSRHSNASKIALAALVAFARAQGVVLIDCQQKTSHLASLGACEMPRTEFLKHTTQALSQPSLSWKFDPLYWLELSEQTIDQ